MSKNQEILKYLTLEVSKEIGIHIDPEKLKTVETRLARRLTQLNMDCWAAYLDYFRKHRKKELNGLISILTTHHTYFFREPSHFNFLKEKLPQIIKLLKSDGRRKLKIWSAACSYGHETYSLAMFLDLQIKILRENIDFEIFGSDVDEQSVNFAQNGVYKWADAKKIPLVYTDDCLQKGQGDISQYVRIAPQLARHCRFSQINLFKLKEELARNKFDIIFCRNVFLYFQPQEIQQIVTNMKDYMTPNAYFMMGLSESLFDIKTPLHHMGQSVYCLPENQLENLSEETVHTTKTLSVVNAKSMFSKKKLTRVICIDDSPTALALLKKILTKEKGFEIVATAKDGLDAEKIVENFQTDVITLDIHMPNKDGLTYLRDNFDSSHPPVVIVSSIERDDGKTTLRALQLGASDYVEKPRIDNLSEVGEELRNKIENLNINNPSSTSPSKHSLTLDKQFTKNFHITQASNKLKIIYAQMEQWHMVTQFLFAIRNPQPPILVSLDATELPSHAVIRQISKQCGLKMELENPNCSLNSNTVYFHKAENLSDYSESTQKLETLVLLLSSPDHKIQEKIYLCKPNRMIIEENATAPRLERSIETSKFPYTSIAYESDYYYIKGQAS